jgi:hypothetical protein
LEECFVRRKLLHLLGFVTLAAGTLHSQPTNGAVYWSTNSKLDCSSLGETSPTPITNASGTTIGYSCYVSGTFVWLAAGGGWSTSIRVAAPASAAIGVDYSFYAQSGSNQNLDTTFGSSSSQTSGNDVNFALYANQPAEVDLLGASSGAPSYSSTATGSVYAVFYCPDATTCNNVLPQLLYSALPAIPWSLSVPITWDGLSSTQWSAEGIDNGGTHRVSLAIYNDDVTAAIYTVRVYDSTGSLVGTGTTPSIPGLPLLSDGSYGEGGTYGALLSDVIKTRLPTGVFKVLIDGGSKYSGVEVLQVNGQSATTLQVAYDTAPGSSSIATAALRSNVRTARVAARPKQVFGTVPK